MNFLPLEPVQPFNGGPLPFVENTGCAKVYITPVYNFLWIVSNYGITDGAVSDSYLSSI